MSESDARSVPLTITFPLITDTRRPRTIHTVSPFVGVWTPSHPTMSLNPAWMGIGPQLSPYTTLFLPFIANTSPTCMQLKHSYNGSKQQCVRRTMKYVFVHFKHLPLLCYWQIFMACVALQQTSVISLLSARCNKLENREHCVHILKFIHIRH